MDFYLIAAAIICISGILLVCKALPPNRWLGVHTARTISDPAAWHRAHRAFGWVFLITGLVATVLILWPTTTAHPVWALFGVLAEAAAVLVIYRRYAA